MNRRQLVVAVGGVLSGGSVAIGTGAFASLRAERAVTVAVSDDARAYLGLRPSDSPNGSFALVTDGTVEIDLTSANPTDAGGRGVNDDALTVVRDIFEVTNRGTDPVALYYESDAVGTEDGTLPTAVELLVSPAGSFDLETLNPALVPADAGPDPRQAFNERMALGPGEAIDVGLAVDSRVTDGLEGTITLVARSAASY